MYTSKAKFLNTVKTLLVGSPLLGGTFITTQMYIVIGEYLGYITKNTLDEIDNTVVANIQNIVRDTTIDAYLVLLGRITTELGI
jgi:hypothetical protein